MTTYKCAKCNFIFERRNEPSQCPHCDMQNIIEANDDEKQLFALTKKSRAAGKGKISTKER